MSCGRDHEVTPVPTPGPGTGGGGTETPNPGTPPAPLTTGLTAQKVNSPKQVTDFLRYLPAKYNEDPNKKWPVIFSLHSVGERGDDINIVKRSALVVKAVKDADFRYILIAPQCKVTSWWDIPSLEVLYAQVMKDYKVDPSRVYLTGMSMGGYGVWSWMQAKPDRFAAAVPICGEGSPDKGCILKDKPLWVFHNADDPTVPVKGSRDMVNAIEACGGKLVKFSESATGGHDAWTRAYAEPTLFTWMDQYTK